MPDETAPPPPPNGEATRGHTNKGMYDREEMYMRGWTRGQIKMLPPDQIVITGHRWIQHTPRWDPARVATLESEPRWITNRAALDARAKAEYGRDMAAIRAERWRIHQEITGEPNAIGPMPNIEEPIEDLHLVNNGPGGAICVAVRGTGDRAGFWRCWSPAHPNEIRNVRWSHYWETIPLQPDSDLAHQALNAIKADTDRRAQRAQTKIEESIRIEVDAVAAEREREIKAATYAMWRPTALTRKDLIPRGWTVGLIREYLTVGAVEKKALYPSRRVTTYLYDLAQVLYVEDILRKDLDRNLTRRQKRQQLEPP